MIYMQVILNNFELQATQHARRHFHTNGPKLEKVSANN